jgi:subfamily B ATP-binding cassette protein MsbA
MRKYARVFKYINAYKGGVALYILFIVLSIIFSIISIGMLMPFFELIFNGDKGGAGLIKQSDNAIVKYIRDFLMQSISQSGNEVAGKLKTLTMICILIIVSIFLKNVFLYLSFYVLNPLMNKVVNQLRSDLFE